MNVVNEGLPADTLAGQATRLLTHKKSIAFRSCSSISTLSAQAVMKGAQAGYGLLAPEFAALEFYGRNHAMSVLKRKFHPLEPLQEDDIAMAANYYRTGAMFAPTMFHYLLLICVRESRHLEPDHSFDQSVAKMFGIYALNFNHKIRGMGSDAAYKCFLSNPPNMRLGPFCKSLSHIFHHGTFDSGYGGPAWGSVADCLVSFVEGETSSEVMLDTAFTLAHNNGPIFNKGMVLGYYGKHFKMILDIQSSGQIPTLISQKPPLVANFVQPLLQNDLYLFLSRHPDAWPTDMDWSKVVSVPPKSAKPKPIHSAPAPSAAQYDPATGYQIAPKSNLGGAQYIKLITPKSRQPEFTKYASYLVNPLPP